jgi:hypothetical protein
MPGIEVQDRLIERSVTGRVVVTEESCCPEIVRISGAGCEMLKDIAQYRDELITGRKPTPPVTQSSAPSHSPQVPPPIASKEEVLLGIDPALAVAEKLARLDALESRWRGRLANQLLPAAKAKCEEALQAIARLRDAYRNQT